MEARPPITNKELIASFMRHEGKTYVTTNRNDLTPLLPFFILDSAYLIYQKEVLPLQCSHRAKFWKDEWKRAYGLLNRSFFAAFSDEQRDSIIDRMDDMAEYLEDAIADTLGRVSTFLIGKAPEEKRGVVASCLVCNILAQDAAIVWEQVYTDAKGHPLKNSFIEKITRASSKFLNSYSPPDERIRCNDDEGIDASTIRLQTRIVEWLKKASEEWA